VEQSLLEFLQQYQPVTQALIATLFTWFVTAAGAALGGMVGFAIMMTLDVALGSPGLKWKD
jgi:hypothetical protein